MVVQVDPERNETRALFKMADFTAKRVLEIGSGDGRLTWLFAEKAKRVSGIEPYAPSVEKAVLDLPQKWKDKVKFTHTSIEDYEDLPESYDIVLLSWSLC